MPSNITLTGYLSEDKYISLLLSCDVVIDLTTRENCLVCGAYEAVEAEKPLISSNTIALNEYFYQGVVFTENNYKDIANSINYAFNNLGTLQREIKNLKREINDKWNSYLDELEILILKFK